MITFFVCIGLLILGFVVYGRIIDKIVQPHEEPTPAIAVNDGVDYIPMPTWKNFVIQLLNIAGTGPIFGALMGALWGPVVFFWIVLGSILGGGVHDFMSGIISMRNKGASMTEFVPKFLGKRSKAIILIVCVFLMIMVTSVFAKSSADMLSFLTEWPVWIWILIVLAYFFVSAFVPIDKIIGRIYPIMGIIVIVMALIVAVGLVFGGYNIPEISVENLHPEGLPIWPFMFITVACGAVSGFHATQSPMIAKCTKDEKKSRHIFYGAMITEGLIALIWAAAGMAFANGDTSLIAMMLKDYGPAGTVYYIALQIAGMVGGTIAVIGVVICPITTGDTALRACRLMIAERFHIDQKAVKKRLMILFALIAFVVLLLCVDFTVLWRYFSWLNQVLAAIMLWTATVFLYWRNKRWWHPLVTCLPALFMTATSAMYILIAPEGLRLPYFAGLAIAFAFTAIVGVVIYRHMRKRPEAGMASAT